MCDQPPADRHKINEDPEDFFYWEVEGGDTGDHLGDGTALDENDVLEQVEKTLVLLENGGGLTPNDSASVVIRKERKGVVTRERYSVQFEYEAVGAVLAFVSEEEVDESDEDVESTEGG
jgi:hypothetical protein